MHATRTWPRPYRGLAVGFGGASDAVERLCGLGGPSGFEADFVESVEVRCGIAGGFFFVVALASVEVRVGAGGGCFF